MSERYVVGADIGGTKVLAALVSVGAPADPPRVVATRRTATAADPDRLVADTAALVAELAAGAGVRVEAVGLGIPGFVDRGGVARQAPNLPSVIDVDLPAALRAATGRPVRADNDANCAAWAAHRVDAPEASTVVAVTLGTGIGGGLVVDGRLLRGAHGFAGEPGHMVVDPDGPDCVCGQRGCWEVWASGSGLGRLARRAVETGAAPGLAAAAADGPVDGPLVTRLAHAGDAEAEAVLDRFGRWVALGLANLANLVDPDVVVLSGGIVEEGVLVLDAVRTHLDGFATFGRGRTIDVRISTLGPAAGALGAALLAARDAA